MANSVAHRERLGRVMAAGFALAAVAGVYALTYVLSWISMGRTAVPLIFGPDLFLYLSLARDLQEGSDLVLRTQYAYFSGAFHLFNIFDRLALGTPDVAVFVNQIAWVGLTFAACTILLRRLYRNAADSSAGHWLVLCLSAQFCLINYSAVAELARFLGSSVSGADFPPPRLPLGRQFYPQMALPFLLLYFAAALNLQRAPRLEVKLLASLTILQLACFWIFPYAAAFAVSVVGCFGFACSLAWGPRLAGRTVVVVLCAAAANFVFLAGLRALHAPPDGGSLRFAVAWFRPELRYQFYSGTFLLQVLLGAALIAWGIRSRGASRIFIGSLCLVQALMLVLDAIVHIPMALRHHFAYLSPFTVGLTLAALFLELAGRFSEKATRLVATSIFCISMVLGSTLAFATSRKFMQTNEHMQRQFLAVEACHGKPDWDSVLAQAKDVDGASDWLPFQFGGQAVFSPQLDLFYPKSATGLVTSPEYYRREAAYMSLYGVSPAQLDSDLQRGVLIPHAGVYARMVYEANYMSGQVLADHLRASLLPVLRKFSDDPALACPVLGQRTLVISEATARISMDRLRRCGEVSVCATFHDGEVLLLESRSAPQATTPSSSLLK